MKQEPSQSSELKSYSGMNIPADLLLSVCMIVRNEASVLEACLGSVRPVADEIIVVDTGSTDNTREIAQSFGARVFTHPWNDDFSEARNAGLDRALGKWILVLDADETLAEESCEKLRRIISKSPAEGIEVRIRNVAPEDDLLAYSDFHLTRLFRNRGWYRYKGSIHEQIRPSIERSGGSVRKSDLLIRHQGYVKETVQGDDSRVERNLFMLAKAVREAPGDPYLLYQLGATYQQTGRNKEAYATLEKAVYNGADKRLLSETAALLYMKLSQLALMEDDYPKAAGYARKSLAIEPGNLISLYVAGVALLYQRKVEDAGFYLRRARNHPQLREEEKKPLDHLVTFCSGYS